MKPFEKRLCKEFEQLTDRIVALSDFSKTPAFSTLCLIERNDLTDQLNVMRKYHRILVRRLNRLEILYVGH